MNALPPLKRNSSLDKVKTLDKMGSSLSPLSSPKPKQSSVSRRESFGKPSLGKTFSQGLSTDTEDKSSSLGESRLKDNPSMHFSGVA